MVQTVCLGKIWSQDIWARVRGGVGLGPFETTFQTQISPEPKEQIEIRLDFHKVERWIFQINICQILPISTPSPQKLGPKTGF